MQVFILQVEGSKRWSLHEARAALPLSDMVRGKGRRPAARISTDELGPAVLAVTLHPGDMLYVPRGMVHHTSTAAVDPSADAWWSRWRFWPSLWTFVWAFPPSTSLSEHDSLRRPPVANPG